MKRAIILLGFILTVFLLAGKTQSPSARISNQRQFETCVNGFYSDGVCDSCYQITMEHHKYWFNKELYPN